MDGEGARQMTRPWHSRKIFSGSQLHPEILDLVQSQVKDVSNEDIAHMGKGQCSLDGSILRSLEVSPGQ